MLRPYFDSEQAKRKTLLLGLFALVYMVVFLPYAYFRNDDWWILGNGVLHLPENWSFAFSPTLFITGSEHVWFFRPLFKFFTFVFYAAFGFKYYLWLLTTLALTIAALWYASKTVELVTRSGQSAFTFVLLFVASMHLHFGSILWMGEGLMNCPQICLLIFNLYFFSVGLLNQSKFHYWIAFLFYFFSIGFKEAAVIHPCFLAALVFSEKPFRDLGWKKLVSALVPYAVLTAAYLVYRLYFLPINEGYVPKWTMQEFGTSSLILAASMALPFLTLLTAIFLEGKGLAKNYFKSFYQRWPYLIFLVLVVAPYLGHPFFSPGWLISPGMYLAIFISLCLPSQRFSKKFFFTLGMALIVASLAPILWKLETTGWWMWHKPQRQILKIFQEERFNDVERIKIYECLNPAYPDVNLSRVVGTPYGLYEAWRLIHGRDIQISFRPCEKAPLAETKTLSVIWRFPDLTVVNP